MKNRRRGGRAEVADRDRLEPAKAMNVVNVNPSSSATFVKYWRQASCRDLRLGFCSKHNDFFVLLNPEIMKRKGALNGQSEISLMRRKSLLNNDDYYPER